MIKDIIDGSVIAILRNSFRLLLRTVREAPFYITISASLNDRQVNMDLAYNNTYIYCYIV